MDRVGLYGVHCTIGVGVPPAASCPVPGDWNAWLPAMLSGAAGVAGGVLERWALPC